MDYINSKYKNLTRTAKRHRNAYKEAGPFPNVVFEDFFDSGVLDAVLEEFPDLAKVRARKYDDPNERKFEAKGERNFGPATKAFMHYLNSEPFLKFLRELTSIERPLIPDPYFSGGGYHEIKPGGLLKIHADFNKHPSLGLDRRLNVLIYLNKDWKEQYGGHFELWDKEMEHCVRRVLPAFNTMALFSTTDFSYHGHPDPLTCPSDRSRKSLALYYYTNGRPEAEINPEIGEHTTLFQARKGFEQDQPREKHGFLKKIFG